MVIAGHITMCTTYCIYKFIDTQVLYWHTRLRTTQILIFGAQRHVTIARVVGELRMNAYTDNRLVFLHLSDIHLNGEDLGSHQDVDQDIRDKLLEDLG